ncbi:NAD(P)/FAD-dependent oxidoreductase [Chitinophagaceae bacterium LB-8]|uniref:NAD(P)/FAD-dependent oxidoreductase n=1 Tax=Paraflavisolibacter caeni TaxID=2982496 RepID=A0A9X3BGG9_9BACT|nr:NAD(P)/FAD-dependent oxidoreductase [Paraflavisolibacter caeni]MCU7547732.1 NAD(P)/FAD-dependent oxidoreductase [Paraflavisolibacter caeni]
MELLDVIIVGGGPAGLNAAVVLGRCHRKVLVFDTGQYRNRYSHGMHNYLTRDGILPADFIRICRQEMHKYGVKLMNKKVVKARKNEEGNFQVQDEDGNIYYAKKLLIATGLTDKLPDVEGFKELYGTSIFHCPYCDGWEVSNQKIGVYARDKNGSELALALKGWSPDITLYTDGKHKIKPHEKEELAACNITIKTNPIARVVGENGQLKKVVFKNGEEQDCDAIFFVNGYEQQCNLAETFDCEINKKGVIVTNRYQQTSTPGLYVAGDADKDMHFVVVAAAEGAKAGIIINKELQKEITLQNLHISPLIGTFL